MSFLTQQQTLGNPKYLFDPKDKYHISLFRCFLDESKWGDPCPFLLEEPYLTIPDMMKDKYIKFQLGIK
jgi:hypothetical protein